MEKKEKKKRKKKKKKKHLYASSPNHFLKLFSEMANSVDARIVRLVSKWIVTSCLKRKAIVSRLVG